jgi:hypothetical protein
MNLRPKIWVIHSILLLALGAVAIYQGMQLHQLSMTAESNPLSATVETLVEQQNTLRSEMDIFSNADFITGAQHQVYKAEMTKLLDDRQADQPTLEWQTLREEVTSLATEAEVIRQDLQELKLLMEQRSPSTEAAKPLARTRAAKAVQKPAPFKTIGVEYRGGDQLLAVSPLGSTHLSEIQLLGVGDTLEGWRLQSLEPGSAHFILPNGSRQAVTIK